MEAIGQHYGLSLQQLLRLASRQAADGSEDIGRMRGTLLEGMLGLYPQFACHLVALIGIHIGIELLVVARDGAPHGGGMGDKDGLDLGGVEV